MNEEKILVSVIVPSLNAKEYIAECLDSILNQTLEDIEVLCIDAGSTDGTLKVLKEYSSKDSRIKIFLSKKRSYGAQVNQGIINAKGDYISIVETDDYIDAAMLKTLYDLSQYSSIDIVKSSFYHVDDSDSKNVKIVKDTAKKSLENVTNYFKVRDYPIFLEGHPSIWSAIYRRNFIIGNKIKFKEEPGGAWVDNPFFYKTAFLAEKILYTNEAYYYYRESNPDSSSNSLKDSSIPMRRILEMSDILDEYDDEDNTFRHMLYKRLFRYVEIIMENNDYDLERLDKNTLRYINDALNLVDEEMVENNINKSQQILYYQLKSPLLLLDLS